MSCLILWLTGNKPPSFTIPEPHVLSSISFLSTFLRVLLVQAWPRCLRWQECILIQARRCIPEGLPHQQHHLRHLLPQLPHHATQRLHQQGRQLMTSSMLSSEMLSSLKP